MKVFRVLKIIFIIALFCLTIYLFRNYIEEYIATQDDPKLWEIRDIISPLFSKDINYTGVLTPLNKRDIMSEISLFKGDKSYTINKKNVYICLKDKKTDEYYNTNMLVYVTLHELSHVINDTIGHDESFNKVFNALLKKASEMGIYNSTAPIDRNYCL